MTNWILLPGSHGDNVKDLQRALNAKGARLDVDGVYGVLTKNAVMEFQRTQGLKVAGIVDPITWGALMGEAQQGAEADAGDAPMATEPAPTPPVFLETVVWVAQKYVGVRETKENQGHDIDRWLRDLGIDFPAAWCMAFVQGCFAEAAKMHGCKDPLKPDTAGVLDLWNRVPKSWRVKSDRGKRGDIMILDFGGGKGHTGIVLGNVGTDYITIEGNTNGAGEREGDCVAVKRRSRGLRTLRGFVRVPGVVA